MSRKSVKSVFTHVKEKTELKIAAATGLAMTGSIRFFDFALRATLRMTTVGQAATLQVSE